MAAVLVRAYHGLYNTREPAFPPPLTPNDSRQRHQTLPTPYFFFIPSASPLPSAPLYRCDEVLRTVIIRSASHRAPPLQLTDDGLYRTGGWSVLPTACSSFARYSRRDCEICLEMLSNFRRFLYRDLASLVCSAFKLRERIENRWTEKKIRLLLFVSWHSGSRDFLFFL